MKKKKKKNKTKFFFKKIIIYYIKILYNSFKLLHIILINKNFN